MNELKCPFCQQELEINDLDVQLLGCENQNCKHSIHYDNVGSKELWQELIRTKELLEVECAEHSMCHTQMLKTTEKLERTHKALELAIDTINKASDALIGCQEADNKYISDITAEDGLELLGKALGKIRLLQKDVK